MEKALNQKFVNEEVPLSYLMLEGSIRNIGKREKTMYVSAFKEVVLNSGVQECTVDYTIQFMHDVGSIILFKYDGKKDLVILNPEWIIDLMSSIITMKHTYVKNGILELDSLPFIWQQYPEDSWEYLLKILDNFEISFKVRDQCIIPSLLPLECDNDILKESWEKRDWTNTYSRIYTFRFLPLGFFGRILVRLLHLEGGLNTVYHWRHGLIAEMGNEWALMRYLHLDYQLQIYVRSKSKSTKLLRLIISCVDTLIEWYGGKPPIISMICPICLEEESSSPTVYSLEECLLTMVNGRNDLSCGNHKKKGEENENTLISVESIAPDIAFVDMKDLIIGFDEIEIIGKIAEGGFGALHKGRYKNKEIAVKILHNQDSQQFDLFNEAFRELQHEAFVMCKLSHQNLVNLIGLCTQPLCLIMNLYPLGSLDRYVYKQGNSSMKVFSWKYRAKLALDISRGLSYLHMNDYIHRDIRSPNILVASLNENSEITCKVTDFGTTVLTAPFSYDGNLNECWMPPEVFQGEQYNQMSDIYSFAILLWELLQIGFPFFEYSEEYAGKAKSDFTDAIIKGLRPTIPQNTKTEYRKIMNECWNHNKLDRPTFVYLTQYFESLYKIY
eukprot:TRINITY_DN844_c0_g2_i1.p1 TRINITY_DN844_c0_g2~~TRINITY_DN844_c0_g2_i1.p1  ORF type:complete len:612 (-),score=100.65 TRINITY_DN844_c0_g2_i1:45-1880(-)